MEACYLIIGLDGFLVATLEAWRQLECNAYSVSKFEMSVDSKIKTSFN